MSDFSSFIGNTGIIDKTLLLSVLDSLACRETGINVSAVSGTFASGNDADDFQTISGLTLNVDVPEDSLVLHFSKVNLSLNNHSPWWFQVAHNVDPSIASSGISDKSYFHLNSNLGYENTLDPISVWTVTSASSYSFKTTLGPLVTTTGNLDWHVYQASSFVLVMKKNLTDL